MSEVVGFIGSKLSFIMNLLRHNSSMCVGCQYSKSCVHKNPGVYSIGGSVSRCAGMRP